MGLNFNHSGWATSRIKQSKMKAYLVIDREKPFGDWHIQQGFADKKRAIEYIAILARVHNDDQDEDCTQFKKTSPERWENDHQYLAIEEIFIVE